MEIFKVALKLSKDHSCVVFIKFLQATMKRKSLENVHKVQATMLKSFFDPMDKI